MTDDETTQRKEEAVKMRAAAKERNVTLAVLGQRFKCSGHDAFNVLQGVDLESEVRDKIFAYLCPPPPKPKNKPVGTPESVNPLPGQAPSGQLLYRKETQGVVPAVVPHVPVVANLLIPSRKEREAARKAAEAAETAKASEKPVAGDPNDPGTPSIAQSRESIFTPPVPDPVPETPVVLRDEPAVAQTVKVGEPPVYPVPGPGEKSDPEVGERIREAMRKHGFSTTALAPYFGHNTGSNISASLSKSGARTLQLRLCKFFGLDAKGWALPGWTEHQTVPKPGEKAPTGATDLDLGRRARAATTGSAMREPGEREIAREQPHAALPASGSYRRPLPSAPATNAVSATFLSDEQTAAAVELALAADELNRATKLKNHAATRYKKALAVANLAGIRFATDPAEK